MCIDILSCMFHCIQLSLCIGSLSTFIMFVSTCAYISSLSALTTIGKYCFANNDISENVHFPLNLQTVGIHAFSKNFIPKIIYNNNLSEIGYGSFQENVVYGP